MLPIAGMINCMRFGPVEGRGDDMLRAMAEYIQDDPFDDIMHAVISLGDSEYALIGVHHSVDSFIAIMNRDHRISDLMPGGGPLAGSHVWRATRRERAQATRQASRRCRPSRPGNP